MAMIPELVRLLSSSEVNDTVQLQVRLLFWYLPYHPLTAAAAISPSSISAL